MQERQLVQKIRMTTLQIHLLHRRVLSLYNYSLHCLTYLSLPKLGNFVNFGNFRHTCMKSEIHPFTIMEILTILKKMSLSWVPCRRRVNDFGNQRSCGICLYGDLVKINCQLHFCVYCCFIGNCKSQCDENNKGGFHPAY